MEGLDPTAAAVAQWGFLGVLVGGIITAVVSIGGELLRGWQAWRLDSAKRQDDRRIERAEIQRKNALELQEALAEWMRAEAQIYLADVAAIRAHGKMTMLPDEVSTAEFIAGRRLMYLTERVTDDELRTMLTDLRSAAATREVGHVMEHDDTTEADLDRTWYSLIDQANATQKQLGTVLRRYL